jgi:predicted  nucleic acid-binding Zn-ribbon protein
MNKHLFLTLSLVALLSACDLRRSEFSKLNKQVDSLKVQLDNNEKISQALQDVGAMIDSIDQNRHVLHTRMIEGTPLEDFKTSMRDINNYVKETEKKIAALENRLSNATTSRRQYALAVNKMKEELEARSNELTALQEKVTEFQNQNSNLVHTVDLQRAEIEDKLSQIEAKKAETTKLEDQVTQLIAQSKLDQAEFYFTKGEILEEAARRTKFAPRKKRNTNKQALDMYQLAVVCGKEEAVAKVEALKKKI